jgi:hypothetical protein
MADAKTWAKRVAAWRASGLTCREFAEREQLPAWRTLRYWAWRLDRESRETKLVRVVREPKPVVAEARTSKVAEVEVRVGGSRVAVELDGEGLAAVLEVLRAALEVAAAKRPA